MSRTQALTNSAETVNSRLPWDGAGITAARKTAQRNTLTIRLRIETQHGAARHRWEKHTAGWYRQWFVILRSLQFTNKFGQRDALLNKRSQQHWLAASSHVWRSKRKIGSHTYLDTCLRVLRSCFVFNQYELIEGIRFCAPTRTYIIATNAPPCFIPHQSLQYTFCSHLRPKQCNILYIFFYDP